MLLRCGILQFRLLFQVPVTKLRAAEKGMNNLSQYVFEQGVSSNL